MRKNIFVFMILGTWVSLPTMAYDIGEFTAPKGADGAACNATITTERCGPNLSVKCYESGQLSTKSGIKMTRTDCNGSNATSFYTYDGDVGTGIYYQGELTDCTALTTLKNNTNVTKNPGYAWFVKNLGAGYDAGKLYIWTDNTFPDCPSGGVPFQGPQGAQGEGVCTDLESSSTAVKNTLRTYSGPSGSTESGGVTIYATRGKMVLTHKMCNTSLNDTVDNENDPCVPIVAPSGVTCDGTYFECKPQGTYTGNTSYAKYNVCEATTGTTFSSALSAAQTAASAANPCAGSNASSATVIKTTSTTAYNRGTKTDNLYPNIGSKTVTKTACNGNTYTTTEQDPCVEIAKPSNVCTAATSAYLRCTTSSVTTDTTYYVCQSLGSGNNSLSNKISAAQSAADTAQATANGKIDANYLTTNNYLTTSSLGTAVSDAITTEIGNGPTGAFKDFVTNGTLNGYVKTSGSDSNSISNVLSSNNVVTTTNVGSCTAGTTSGKNTTVTCTSDSLAGQLLDALLPAINAAASGNTVSRQ